MLDAKRSQFVAYLDASGTDHDQPVLVVAGFVALSEQWTEFEVAWNERLRRDGLERFHMKEINGTLKARSVRGRKLLQDLASIIESHVTRKFGCCVVNKALAGIPRSETTAWHINAYSLAGRSCAAQIRAWTKSWGARSVPTIVFETGDRGRDQLVKIFKRDDFETPNFEGKNTVPLQAADLFAYSVFEPTRKIEVSGRLSELPWLHDSFRKVPGEARYIGIEEMEDLRQRLNEPKLFTERGNCML